MIIAIHSYKGGTGKTVLSVNLATMLANRGRRICLLDLDFRAPSLHVVFKTGKSEYWLNDYLNGICEIDRVLTDYSSPYVAEGKMSVGLANPSTEAIREMSAKDRKWGMKALGRLLSLKTSLLEELQFDYVIFDTSPGIQYYSINSIVSADSVLVVTTPDQIDMGGTQRMMNDLYESLGKKAAIIMNKIPLEFPSSKNREGKQTDPKTTRFSIVGAIACSCDILNSRGGHFFASENPNHPFTKSLQRIISNISYHEIIWTTT